VSIRAGAIFPDRGHEIEFALADSGGLVFPVVNVRRRTTAGRVLRFHDRHRAVGVPSVNADEHGNAEDVDGLAATGRDVKGFQKRPGGFVERGAVATTQSGGPRGDMKFTVEGRFRMDPGSPPRRFSLPPGRSVSTFLS
jgi:hypothetical protein